LRVSFAKVQRTVPAFRQEIRQISSILGINFAFSSDSFFSASRSSSPNFI
jgi:hypothetical protein